jgi:signal transduction histidine kinase
LVLSVIDDGVGFDVQTAMRRASKGDSLGLLSMQDRAEQLGGRLIINSRPREGTEVQVRLPLDRTACLDDV